MADRPKHAGKSIMEMLWDLLDAKMIELMDCRDDTDYTSVDDLANAIADGASISNARLIAEEYTKVVKLQGDCAGLTAAITTMTYSYMTPEDFKRNFDAVKKEAMERWEANMDDEYDEEDEEDEG